MVDSATDWREAILVPFFKKGANYRGISLLDIAAKAFISVLLRRFQSVQDKRTCPTQGGFRPGRRCVYDIFILRRTLEKRHSNQQPTVIFVDLAAASDLVDRQALYRIMEEDVTPPKLLRLIEAYFSSTLTRVRAAGQETTAFDVQSGVR